MKIIKDYVISILKPKCNICDRDIDGSSLNLYICPDCYNSLLHFENDENCSICAHPLIEGKCPSCYKLGKIYFDSFRTLGYYREMNKKIIYKLKKEQYSKMNNIIIDALIQKQILKYDMNICVIPDAITDRIKKGAAGMTGFGALLKKKGFKVNNFLEKRISESFKKQKYSKKRERFDDVKNKFYIGQVDISKIDRVLLIDDIYTSGSTLNYCSGILKMIGIKEVHCVSFFRNILRIA